MMFKTLLFSNFLYKSIQIFVTLSAIYVKNIMKNQNLRGQNYSFQDFSCYFQDSKKILPVLKSYSRHIFLPFISLFRCYFGLKMFYEYLNHCLILLLYVNPFYISICLCYSIDPCCAYSLCSFKLLCKALQSNLIIFSAI